MKDLTMLTQKYVCTVFYMHMYLTKELYACNLVLLCKVYVLREETQLESIHQFYF